MQPFKGMIFAALVAVFISGGLAAGARADKTTPYPGTVVMKTGYDYTTLVTRLKAAIKKNRMGLVAAASATVGAKSIGKTIPGNMVLMVYRPDFAVRMLAASVPAGIEAPIRYYITEDKDGKTTLTYRKPSALFKPYENAALDKMAAELDVIFAQIAKDALGG
jgi:uncharacterized protein (DUF302 family)